MFRNLMKTTCGHVFNVNFGQAFQSSHQTDIPYRNGMQNLRRDVCAPEKELLHHLQLKQSKEFETSSSRAPGNKRSSLELQMPSTTVWQVVRKHLHIIPYKLHLLQHLKDTDKSARKDFCTQMQECWKKMDLMTVLCFVTKQPST